MHFCSILKILFNILDFLFDLINNLTFHFIGRLGLSVANMVIIIVVSSTNSRRLGASNVQYLLDSLVYRHLLGCDEHVLAIAPLSLTYLNELHKRFIGTDSLAFEMVDGAFVEVTKLELPKQ